jgi:hypothetical protein
MIRGHYVGPTDAFHLESLYCRSLILRHQTVSNVGLAGGRPAGTSHGSYERKLAILSQCLVVQGTFFNDAAQLQ